MCEQQLGKPNGHEGERRKQVWQQLFLYTVDSSDFENVQRDLIFSTFAMVMLAHPLQYTFKPLTIIPSGPRSLENKVLHCKQTSLTRSNTDITLLYCCTSQAFRVAPQSSMWRCEVYGVMTLRSCDSMNSHDITAVMSYCTDDNL